MYPVPYASPGNIDWQLFVPRQQAFGVGSWIPIAKPGNCGWLYIYMVGGGSGGSGGATGAAGTARAGGGSGGTGASVTAIIPWATLPDVIYACPGIGGTAGAANLGSGGAGAQSVIQVEPIGTISTSYWVLGCGGGLAPSGTTGANAGSTGAVGVFSFCAAPAVVIGGSPGVNGGATGAGSNMNMLGNGSRFCGGASGAGTTTGNVNAAGGGLNQFFPAGPGQILGAINNGQGGGAAAGGAGLSGRELGQGPGSPLDLFLLTGNSRPLFFVGGCGGGSNGASGVGGAGGAGDWGCGGGGGAAGVTGGVGGKGGDGFIIIGNF